MLIVMVHVNVKPECVDAFIQETIKNAQASLKEPLVARFDLIQQEGEKNRFLLVEVYRNEEGPVKHKQTDHYKKWKETVEEMMAEPRTSIRYVNLFPDDKGW